jgi:serine protease AprX
MALVPATVIEYLLQGKTRPDVLETYTQDGGVSTDVWIAYGESPVQVQRLLLAPAPAVNAIQLAATLNRLLTRQPLGAAQSPGISALDTFVTATLSFDALVHSLLPLSVWWERNNLGALADLGSSFSRHLERAIRGRLMGTSDEERSLRLDLIDEKQVTDRRVLQVTPVAATIGAIQLAREQQAFSAQVQQAETSLTTAALRAAVSQWAGEIAVTACKVLRSACTAVDSFRKESKVRRLTSQAPVGGALVQRVFLNREAQVADTDALCTVKADAATRLFDISCRNITWAVIDAGIAGKHKAFLDHDAKDALGAPITPTPSRVRATYDFTQVEQLRSFDLIASPPRTVGRRKDLARVARALRARRAPVPGFYAMALRQLRAIAAQLDAETTPDWGLIEPLILLQVDDGATLPSDHGTHVAGILGADWRGSQTGPDGRPTRLLQGVCPDINLYDMRVVDAKSQAASESALISALQFIRFLNNRGSTSDVVVAGANISMSIPHKANFFGCGLTPVCIECDRLVESGVVVVTAAGNRGWSEGQFGFGSSVFSSITDPGNAEKVVTVGSTHRVKPHQFGISYFSSRGPTADGRSKPDLVAPGEKIRGPIRGDADLELDGTSMAAPFVSGAAALLVARHKELLGDPIRVKQVLCETATDLGRERYFQGHGLVDILRALQRV